MGVHGLWKILEPAHHPIRLETLARKRLAIDASIWIYQFLKAVRDKQGHALTNSHIVGFFRRICKLLFHGVQPVFVFDGGAPLLKRQTVARRRRRAEDRKIDAKEGARRLLALRIKKAVQEERNRRRNPHKGSEDAPQHEHIPDDIVYVDELNQSAAQRQLNRQKLLKKTDQFELPALPQELDQLNAQNDVRLLSQEELAEYAREFEGFDENSLNDYTNIDFNSPFFASLPAADRYRILNHARLRSRLRMGYSKEQLDVMFPNRMAFSKFQIERLTRRNELSQRLMTLQAGDAGFKVSRVAGEKGKEYVLVRNEGEQGGWVMSFVGQKQAQGDREKPIEVEEGDKPVEIGGSSDEEEAEFEDVPIQGLNREVTERRKRLPEFLESEETRQMRKAVYESRKEAEAEQGRNDPNALFLGDDEINDDFADQMQADDGHIDEELRKAIEMSLGGGFKAVSNDDEDLQWAIKMSVEGEGKGKQRAAPAEYHEPDEDEDFQQAVAASRQPQSNNKGESSGSKPGGLPAPLDLDLGKSSSFLMSKKVPALKKSKAQQTEDAEKEVEEEKSIPLPPWFAKAPKRDIEAEVSETAEVIRQQERQLGQDHDAMNGPTNRELPAIETEDSDDGMEMEDVPLISQQKEFTAGDLAERLRIMPPRQRSESSRSPERSGRGASEGSDVSWVLSGDEKEGTEGLPKPTPRQHRNAARLARGAVPMEIHKPAELPVQAAVPVETQRPLEPVAVPPNVGTPKETAEHSIGLAASDTLMQEPAKMYIEPEQQKPAEMDVESEEQELANPDRTPSPVRAKTAQTIQDRDEDSDEALPWSDSEGEEVAKNDTSPTIEQAEATKVGALVSPPPANSPTLKSPPRPQVDEDDDLDISFEHDTPPPPDQEEYLEDAEENELLLQMAQEADEHTRFAASISNQPPAPVDDTIDDTIYNTEINRLAAQHRKDLQGADEITQTMVHEVQQLLTLFGLPYITAPMEAEAQCAELVRLNLVDGIVTDDSDVFLFGGTRVYRYMFNDKHHVQCYLLSDIAHELALPQNRLIDAAQLLGSDYTDGIPGIGPVTALELLAEFQDLETFKSWWTRIQTGAKDPHSTPFRTKFTKANLAKIHLPSSFPDPNVADAYLHAEVDSDKQPFEWGVPDLDGLREYFGSMLGWEKERTDQVLLPVVRDMNKKLAEGQQANLTRFFGADGFAPRMRGQGSKRLEKAVEKLKGGGQEGEGEGGKRKRPMSMREIAEAEEAEKGDEEVEEPVPKKKKKAARGKGTARGRGKKKA